MEAQGSEFTRGGWREQSGGAPSSTDKEDRHKQRGSDEARGVDQDWVSHGCGVCRRAPGRRMLRRGRHGVPVRVVADPPRSGRGQMRPGSGHDGGGRQSAWRRWIMAGRSRSGRTMRSQASGNASGSGSQMVPSRQMARSLTKRSRPCPSQSSSTRADHPTPRDHRRQHAHREHGAARRAFESAGPTAPCGRVHRRVR